MITCYDTVKAMMRTEKAVNQLEDRKYFFRVDKRATKIDVRRAVQEIYNVQVQDVNMICVKGKKRRVRQRTGYAPDWKKAIVTLKDGQTIEVV